MLRGARKYKEMETTHLVGDSLAVGLLVAGLLRMVGATVMAFALDGDSVVQELGNVVVCVDSFLRKSGTLRLDDKTC